MHLHSPETGQTEKPKVSDHLGRTKGLMLPTPSVFMTCNKVASLAIGVGAVALINLPLLAPWPRVMLAKGTF